MTALIMEVLPTRKKLEVTLVVYPPSLFGLLRRGDLSLRSDHAPLDARQGLGEAHVHRDVPQRPMYMYITQQRERERERERHTDWFRM